jgi:hypothetical protein
LLSAILITSVFFSVYFAWISADAPYYISVGRDVSEGKVLFRDVVDHYTPLVSVLFSYVYTVYDNPPFTAFVVVHLSVIVLSSWVMFLLLRNIDLSLVKAAIVSIAFCLGVLSSDGNYIILESYSLLFVLLAFFSLIKDRGYFLAGMLLGCSFLCKQYGVLNFIPFFFFIFWRKDPASSKLNKALMLGAGGFLVFASFIAYYTFKGADSFSLLEQISGVRYAQSSVARERSPLSFFLGAKVFILFLSIPLLYVIRYKKISVELKFCAIGIFVSLFPIYVQAFQHYYINTFPYLFFAIGFLLLNIRDRTTATIYVIMLFLATIISSGLLFVRMWRYSSRQEEQLEIAHHVSQHIPRDSYVFIHGQYRYLYILNNYKNPFTAKIGYDYSFNNIDSLLKLNTVTIISTKRFPQTDNLTEIRTDAKSIFIYRPEPPLNSK